MHNHNNKSYTCICTQACTKIDTDIYCMHACAHLHTVAHDHSLNMYSDPCNSCLNLNFIITIIPRNRMVILSWLQTYFSRQITWLCTFYYTSSWRKIARVPIKKPKPPTCKETLSTVCVCVIVHVEYYSTEEQLVNILRVQFACNILNFDACSLRMLKTKSLKSLTTNFILISWVLASALEIKKKTCPYECTLLNAEPTDILQ